MFHSAHVRKKICNMQLLATYTRWLREYRIALSSERKQRKRAEVMVGDNLEAEAVPFTFSLASGGEEIRAAPIVYVPDLVEKVFALLQENEE